MVLIYLDVFWDAKRYAYVYCRLSFRFTEVLISRATMQLEHMYVAIQVQLMKTTNRIAIVSIEIIRNYPSAIHTVHDKEH